MLTNTKNDNKLDEVARLFAYRLPFNRELGLEIDFNNNGEAVLSFEMQAKLVGNFVRGNLHGGVISTVLDAIGGFVIFNELLHREENVGLPIESVFERLGTIDIRVDYLRPGLGKKFFAKASITRAGRRVAVAHMELRNDSETLIATGVGAYVVGSKD